MNRSVPNRSDIRWRTFLLCFAVAFAAILLSALAKLFLSAGFGWRCPIMAVLQMPCPSCGSTRALAALSDFNLWQALRFNPLITLAIPTSALAFHFRDRLAQWPLAWPFFFGAVFMNWVYLLLFLPR